MTYHSPQIAQELTLELRKNIKRVYGSVAEKSSFIRLTPDGWILVRIVKPVGTCLVSQGMTCAMRPPQVAKLIERLSASLEQS